MKKLILIFTCLVGYLYISGCEESVTGIELPYVEKMVIQVTLNANEQVKFVSITRTLPPLDEYTLLNAEIKDAIAVITCEGNRYPLKYADSGRYVPENLIAISGKKYELNVEWNGKSAYSSTVVPYPLDLDTAYINYTEYLSRYNILLYDFSVDCEYKPKSNTAYLLSPIATYINGSQTYSYHKNDNITRYEDKRTDGKIHSSVVFATYNAKNVNLPKIECTLESYDIPFYNYYITRNNSSANSDDFLSKNGGSNVLWNVTGDGIGLFIGRAVTRKKIN